MIWALSHLMKTTIVRSLKTMSKIFCCKYETIRKFETVYSQDLLLRYSSYHDGKFYVNLSSDESVKGKSFGEIKEFMR